MEIFQKQNLQNYIFGVVLKTLRIHSVRIGYDRILSGKFYSMQHYHEMFDLRAILCELKLDTVFM